MKKLQVVETVRYRFENVPDHITEDTAEDWFTDLPPAERDDRCTGVQDRSVELL